MGFMRIMISGALVLLVSFCGRPGELVVVREVTGPNRTNCYLVYDAVSREAALIDVGGPIDTLLARIDEQGLEVKYIFATHGHVDHVEGVPQVRERFPEALLGYNKDDWEDMPLFVPWLAEQAPEQYERMRQDSAFRPWLEYDYAIFGPPDITLEDNQIYQLGNLELRTLLTPGHTRGHMCFAVGDALFSGSVLMDRRVGSPNLMGGSREAIIASARRLYAEFPDDTKVYPAHRRVTNLGMEKRENRHVTPDKVDF